MEKHDDVKLKEDVLGRFYFEKNQKNANLCAIGVQQNKHTYILAGYVLSLVFYEMPDQGSS